MCDTPPAETDVNFYGVEYIKLALAAIGDCEILEPEFNFMTFGPSGLIYLIQIYPSNVFW